MLWQHQYEPFKVSAIVTDADFKAFMMSGPSNRLSRNLSTPVASSSHIADQTTQSDRSGPHPSRPASSVYSFRSRLDPPKRLSALVPEDFDECDCSTEQLTNNTPDAKTRVYSRSSTVLSVVSSTVPEPRLPPRVYFTDEEDEKARRSRRKKSARRRRSGRPTKLNTPWWKRCVKCALPLGASAPFVWLIVSIAMTYVRQDGNGIPVETVNLLDQYTKVASTAFFGLSSAVLAFAIKAYADLLVERGIELSYLEQLVQSRTMHSTVHTFVSLRTFNVTALVIVFAWLLTLAGSQACLRSHAFTNAIDNDGNNNNKTVMIISFPWFCTLCFTSLSILITAATGCIFTIRTTIPDILGYCSSMVRFSQYFDGAKQGTTASGMAMARRYKDMEVRLGQVMIDSDHGDYHDGDADVVEEEDNHPNGHRDQNNKEKKARESTLKIDLSPETRQRLKGLNEDAVIGFAPKEKTLAARKNRTYV